MSPRDLCFPPPSKESDIQIPIFAIHPSSSSPAGTASVQCVVLSMSMHAAGKPYDRIHLLYGGDDVSIQGTMMAYIYIYDTWGIHTPCYHCHEICTHFEGC